MQNYLNTNKFKKKGQVLPCASVKNQTVKPTTEQLLKQRKTPSYVPVKSQTVKPTAEQLLKQNAKLARAARAREVLDVCINGKTPAGQLVPVLPASVTELEYNPPVINVINPAYSTSELNVVLQKKTVQDVLYENRAEHKHILVLNFASYINPGGGFLNGAIAQEEALCGVTNLYYILNNLGSMYYLRHKLKISECESVYNYLYGDDSLFASQITLLVNEDGSFISENPYGFDVLTTAAPNLKRILSYCDIKAEDALALCEQSMFFRINHIMTCILNLSTSYDRIILGAFGCGAFGNDAEYVATLFRDYITNMQSSLEYCNFKEIQFVMPDDANYNKFKKSL